MTKMVLLCTLGVALLYMMFTSHNATLFNGPSFSYASHR
jgi:hypothetical protein